MKSFSRQFENIIHRVRGHENFSVALTLLKYSIASGITIISVCGVV